MVRLGKSEIRRYNWNLYASHATSTNTLRGISKVTWILILIVKIVLFIDTNQINARISINKQIWGQMKWPTW